MQQQSALGQTGTMYDGNNANLQLAPEQNGYWRSSGPNHAHR
jgi:hypothetical protein